MTFSKFSILSSSFKDSDLLYESNFEISIPPQKGQVELLSETSFGIEDLDKGAQSVPFKV